MLSVATADVQSILEIPATDEIHMEDRNHGLAWTKPNNGIYNTQRSQQTCASRVKFESCGTRTLKGERNLYIELQKHKLDQIAARNKRISLDKRIAF